MFLIRPIDISSFSSVSKLSYPSRTALLDCTNRIAYRCRYTSLSSLLPPCPALLELCRIAANTTSWLSVARLCFTWWISKKEQCFIATSLANGRVGSGLPCEASHSLLCSYFYRHFVNVPAPFLLSRGPTKCWSTVDMLEHFQLSVAALATSWKE
jgi:hypothetical protein